jgi:CheY-like chemotaxis protein/HPt (histidine-containing phosphotransfer) domain-containing protein
VIVNLVGNAIKFTEQGEVVIDVRQESRLENQVLFHFAVTDTGVGVPEDKRGAIFDAFEQADNTSTRRFGGTGLGLAISARLVELLGGRIWLESALGRGSTFHFTALFNVASFAPPPASRTSQALLPGTKVLVVDDNATNRRILEEMLSNWEMRPLSAASAVDGLRLLREAQETSDPVRLVLTDSHMPNVDGFDLVAQIRRSTELGSTIIMMLTSGDQPGDIERCAALGISTYLVKPVKQSELLDAIAEAMGDVELEEPDRGRSDGEPSCSIPPLRILLAEDSLVNQRLAVGLLEKWGHSISVVNNGKQAVAALLHGDFDLVIMDVQMPEMDGLEATELIRAQEKVSGKHVPILAMTAHAMKGDRELCLAAGMDAYLAKPVRAKMLRQALAELVGGRTACQASDNGERSREGRVDWTVALQAVQQDRALLKEVVEAFLEEYPKQLADLRAGIERGDAATAKRAAHTLKGSLRYFGATRACDAAYRLELSGRSGRLDDTTSSLVELVQELEQLQPELARFVECGQGPTGHLGAIAS